MKRTNLWKIIILIISIFLFYFNIFYTLSNREKVVEVEISEPVIDKVDKKDDDNIDIDDKKYISVRNSTIYKNDNYIGNLLIENTNFKEPIYQYEDNDYYLTHDGLGRKKSSGATYLDYRVNILDKKLLIYGHNNNSLSLPFSILENYNDYDYYQKHKYLYLEVDDELYKYEIFSVYVEISNWDYMKIEFASFGLWGKHLEDLKKRSFYDTGVEVTSDDSILILQTCSKNDDYASYSNKYMLVIAKLVK